MTEIHYWTLEEIKRGNDGNYLFITTHSPYILFALFINAIF